MLHKIDRGLNSVFGLPYVRLTRDQAIYDRCEYFLCIIRDVETQRLRILDVGCGSGAVLKFISYKAPGRVAHYTGIDLHASRLLERYRNIDIPHSFQDVDLDTDWNVGSFDVAWCSECIEHILDDKGVFQKICRSVRRGGLIVITMPSLTHRERVGKNLPELLEVASIQDGGHVHLGYDQKSLAALCLGTTAELIQCDGVTKADLSYMRRRYRWPGPLQLLNNLYNEISRADTDSYALGNISAIDYAEYQSIGAVYRVN